MDQIEKNEAVRILTEAIDSDDFVINIVYRKKREGQSGYAVLNDQHPSLDIAQAAILNFAKVTPGLLAEIQYQVNFHVDQIAKLCAENEKKMQEIREKVANLPEQQKS